MTIWTKLDVHQIELWDAMIDKHNAEGKHKTCCPTGYIPIQDIELKSNYIKTTQKYSIASLWSNCVFWKKKLGINKCFNGAANIFQTHIKLPSFKKGSISAVEKVKPSIILTIYRYLNFEGCGLLNSGIFSFPQTSGAISCTSMFSVSWPLSDVVSISLKTMIMKIEIYSFYHAIYFLLPTGLEWPLLFCRKEIVMTFSNKGDVFGSARTGLNR